MAGWEIPKRHWRLVRGEIIALFLGHSPASHGADCERGNTGKEQLFSKSRFFGETLCLAIGICFALAAMTVCLATPCFGRRQFRKARVPLYARAYRCAAGVEP
eukprot:s3201_g3.t1